MSYWESTHIPWASLPPLCSKEGGQGGLVSGTFSALTAKSLTPA